MNRKQYRYDAANRQTGIVSAEADGAKERFLRSNRYDGEGLRYETEENGKIIRFLFDRGELAQEKQEGEEISYIRGHKPISLSRAARTGITLFRMKWGALCSCWIRTMKSERPTVMMRLENF